MDAEQLAAMMTALENGEVVVKPTGEVVNKETEDEFRPCDIMLRLIEAEKTLDRLKKIALWASAAPEVVRS